MTIGCLSLVEMEVRDGQQKCFENTFLGFLKFYDKCHKINCQDLSLARWWW